MVGEDTDQNTIAENAFYAKGVWQRFSVVFAGPFFNFILAFALSVFVIGFVGYDAPTIASVVAGSAADEAGLKAGDLIKKIGKDKVAIGREVDSYFLYNPTTDKPIEIVFERDGIEKTTIVEPKMTKQYLLGFNYMPDENAAKIMVVSENYPMHQAGILPDDIITHVNGNKISTGA
jgi:regulator of sigma E protease